MQTIEYGYHLFQPVTSWIALASPKRCSTPGSWHLWTESGMWGQAEHLSQL